MKITDWEFTQHNKLKIIPINKLEEMISLLKKIRSNETRKHKEYKKLESAFKKEIRSRKK